LRHNSGGANSCFFSEWENEISEVSRTRRRHRRLADFPETRNPNPATRFFCFPSLDAPAALR
jgi:hypothetical protein